MVDWLRDQVDALTRRVSDVEANLKANGIEPPKPPPSAPPPEPEGPESRTVTSSSLKAQTSRR